jgi:Cu+-exporting ATPase
MHEHTHQPDHEPAVQNAPELPASRSSSAAGPVYTCPMHPEIVRDAPGTCPICGMALESRTASAEEGDSAELRDMRRRFWFAVLLTFRH